MIFFVVALSVVYQSFCFACAQFILNQTDRSFLSLSLLHSSNWLRWLDVVRFNDRQLCESSTEYLFKFYVALFGYLAAV